MAIFASQGAHGRITALPPGGLGEASFKPIDLNISFLRACLWTFALVVIVLVIAPSIYLFVWAFKGTETVGVLDKATWHWFGELFSSPEWRESILYSFLLAAFSSALGTALLVVHFYFMRFVSPFHDRISYTFLILSVTVPPVIYALALRIVGASWNLSEIFLVFMGNAVLILPVQFFCLETAQETVPTEMLHAGNTMGATHGRNILFVYLPLLRKAAWTAFLVGFFFSFDELVISTFVIDSPLVTVPRRLWDQVPQSMNPLPAVVSCLLISTYAFMWLTRRLFQVVNFNSENSGDNVKAWAKELWELLNALRHYWREMLTPIVIALILGWKNLSEHWWYAVLHTVVGAAIGFLWVLIVLRREITILSRLRRHTHERLRKPLALFFRKRLENLESLEKEISGRNGGEFSVRELKNFVSACFKTIGAKRYIGTDSNVPSRFHKLYPNYLKEHFNPTRAGRPGADARILFASENELRDDFSQHREEFNRFYEAHKNNYVSLLQVEQVDADKLANGQELPSPDIGIFGDDFVVFYKPISNQAGDVQRCTVSVRPLDKEMKDKLSQYLLRLNDVAKEIRLLDDKVTCNVRDNAARVADQSRLIGHLK